MITLPAGIYHRFSNDENNYAKVMRLFQGEPIWTPFNRDAVADKFGEREKYVQLYLGDESPFMAKVHIDSPTNWSDLMNGLKNPITFVFFRSASDKDTGVSSQVACQRATPIVKSALCNNISQPFTLVDCEVDPQFLKNPDHPYITEQKIKLSVLPTLLHWGTSHKIEGGQLHDDAVVSNFVKTCVPQ